VTGTASTSKLVASNAFTFSTVTGVLHAVSGVISASLVNLASDVTGILPVGNGGTGWAAIASGAIPYGNGSSALATTTIGTAGQVLALLNGVPTWTPTTTLSTISGTLGVAQGGTGATSFTGNGIVYSNGSILTSTASSASAILLTNSSGVPSFSTTLPAFTLGGAITGNAQTLLGLGNFRPPDIRWRKDVRFWRRARADRFGSARIAQKRLPFHGVCAAATKLRTGIGPHLRIRKH
jgi:hypothetical protein